MEDENNYPGINYCTPFAYDTIPDCPDRSDERECRNKGTQIENPYRFLAIRFKMFKMFNKYKFATMFST